MKRVLEAGFVALFVALAVAFMAAPASAAVAGVADNSTLSILAGNRSQIYNLQVNITPNQTTRNINVTIILPYGMMNNTACNATSVTTTTFACVLLFATNASILFQANLSVKVNITGFPVYGSSASINYTVDGDELTQNSTLRTPNVLPFWRNPRPHAAAAQVGNVVLRFMQWNQTDTPYRVMVPIWTFNQTAGRPQLANTTYGEVVYFDKSFFEQPSYMRLWGYNLTFRIIFDGVENRTFVMRSPINNSLSSDQGLFPLFSRRQEILDFHSNNTRNFTIGVPDQNMFTIFLNGTELNNSALNNSYGLNITFSGGDQSTLLFDINATTTNITKINNTDISIFLTVVNITACQTGGACTRTPIYVNLQDSRGLNFDEPPKFGQSLNISFLVNVTNRFANYTVDDIRLSFMQPMNVTMNESGTVRQFNMTLPTSVKLQVWNSSAVWQENLSMLRNDSNMSFNDTSGPAKGTLVSVYMSTFDVVISNNTGTFSSWDPGTGGSGYAYVNFTAEMKFPVLDESAVPAGGGGSNSYNVTVNSPVQTRLNLTDKVAGLDSSATGVVVTLNGETVSASNYTIGSLILNSVPAGQSSVSVAYTVPTTSTAAAAATSSSGGSGPTSEKKTFSFTNPQVGTLYTAPLGDKDVAIQQLEFKFAESVDSAKITVDVVTSLPATTPAPSGTAFQYISISSPVADSLTDIKAKFAVSKSWISGSGFANEDISLRRFADGVWQKLTTRFVSEDGSNANFEADVPGFSTFAVVGEKVELQAAAEPPPPQAAQPEEMESDEGIVSETGEPIVVPILPPGAIPAEYYYITLFAIFVALAGYLHYHHAPHNRAEHRKAFANMYEK